MDFPFSWTRQAPEAFTLELVDDADAAIDITFMTFALQARAYASPLPTALLTLGMAAAGQPGFAIDDGPAGRLTVTPPAVGTLETLPLPIEPDDSSIVLRADLIMIHPDGYRELVLPDFPLTIYNGVTRP